jgi:ribosomal-protein-alanine N-acetyltransferase
LKHELVPAEPGSAAALAALHAVAFPQAQRWGADAIALLLALPGAFGVRRPCAGFVLARVAVDEAEVLTLAVAPAARRQRLGLALMRAAMAEAKQRGAVAMFLDVAADNAAARGLYASLGFVEVGRRRRYYDDGTDALTLRGALG